MSKRRKAPLALAAVLLSETTACLCTRVPICDPVPPPPSQTVSVPTVGVTRTPTRTPVRTSTPMICDPVPPPPYLTAQAATRTAQATAPRVPTPTGPPVICDPVPPPPFLTAQAATSTAQARRGPTGAVPEATPETRTAAPLPLAQRLALRISVVPGQPNVYRVDTDFAATEVWWTVSAGTLEPCEEGVRWVPPAKGGTVLLQAMVDAGPAGVAVDALTVTAAPAASS